MLRWLAALRAPQEIPAAAWQRTLDRYPFLASLLPAERERLRELAAQFLHEKRFHGANGVVVGDDVALAVAAQAVLLLLHLTAGQSPRRALRWFDDFVGIVVHPGEVVARRQMADESGVVHDYTEVLAGEAMERGPVMVNWHDVERAGATAQAGYNVVVHEFAHKIDMRDGAADGCPPLAGRSARAAWLAVLQPAFEAFRERVIVAERFGGEPPWLDAYAATSIDEFFAVACEAYCVNRARFAQEFPALQTLFDGFFRRK